MNASYHSEIKNQKSPHGFTLVELLVVIGIIAALASLLLVAGGAAIRAAREAAIQVECTQLANGFQSYTNDVSGGAYPPNLTLQNATNAQVINTFNRHFNAAFSNHRESAALLEVLSTGTSSDSDYTLVGTPQSGISPYEAVVFWLGGFSSDLKYPISGPGGPSFRIDQGEDFAARNTKFDFDQARLQPVVNGTFSGRYIEYPDPRDDSITRRINLWYYVPKKVTVPFAYFNASSKPKFEPLFTINGQTVAPIKTLKINSTAMNTANLRLANDGQCQILSAGLDDAWGDFANSVAADWSQANYNGIVYPDGPWTGELADTITNFGTGRTLEDSQP